MDRRFFVTLDARQHRVKTPKQRPARTVAATAAVHSTSRVLRGVKQAQPIESTPEVAESNLGPQKQQLNKRREFTDLAGVVAAVDRVTKAFLAQQGIPSEKTTRAALRACAQNDVKLLLDAEAQPEMSSNRDGPSDTTVSHLLELDRNGRAGGKATAAAQPQTPTLRLQDVVAKMSEAAYAIVTHPPVVITPRVLEDYVNVQARLGKPETLPHVLSLYASKPQPRSVSGTVRYAKQNPNKMEKAVDTDVADTALDAAIEAKNLAAAIGIIEHTYATEASVRSKVFRKALMPVSFFAAAPVIAYFAASRLSYLQDSMDHSTATGVAFVGILTYVGFTATIGLVAASTANDQMKRVTWAPGTPLRRRFVREDERAAFDKVACSFGFSENHRYGEEEGEEFQALRQYILGKSMVLDAVELMEGMN